MRAIDLELKRDSRRPGLASYALAAAALAFAADTAFQYRTLQERVALREAQLAGVSVPARAKRNPTVDGEAYKTAAETVRRLAAPWDRLFDALEAAQTERVVLASIEPDVQAGTLSISGEAADYLSVLTYLARLSEQPALSRLHLARHETRPGPRPALEFTISAQWRGGR